MTGCIYHWPEPITIRGDQPLVVSISRLDASTPLIRQSIGLGPLTAYVQRVGVNVIYSQYANGEPRMSSMERQFQIIPFHDLEQIAAMVRNLSSDSLCQVIADAILDGRK
jgi:hypothetical protein